MKENVLRQVDKYFALLRSALPLGNREDIVRELKSNFLDEAEQRFGGDPEEDEIRSALAELGPPRKLAAEYAGEPRLMAPPLVSLFRTIMVIILGALTLSFMIVLIIELLQNAYSSAELVRQFFLTLLQIFQAWISGVGVLLLVFMGISTAMKNPSSVLDEDTWDISRIDQVQLGDEIESRVGAYIGLGISLACILVLAVYPGIISFLEELYLLSTLPLDHRVNLEIFPWYVAVFAALWVFQLVHTLYGIRLGRKTLRLRWMESGYFALEAVVMFVMVNHSALWIGGGWRGARIFFLLAFAINGIELLYSLYRLRPNRLSQDQE